MSQGEHRPAQARSRQTRDRIVGALAGLLDRHAFDDITIPMIAKAAGIAVGTLYGRFESRAALFPVIFEIYETRLKAFMDGPGRVEVNAGDGLYRTIQRVVEASWTFLTDNRNLVRAAYSLGRQHPERLGREWSQYIELAVTGSRQLLAAFPDEVAVEDRERAARMVTYLVNVTPLDFGLFGRDGVGAALAVSETEFVEDTARTIYGYLVARAGE